MATTTNYGWTTPDDTALVKDGASAIRTLGSSVDTTVKALNPSTTLGDIEYRSSTANTNTRLGIGTSGQGLLVVAGVPAWAASSTSTLTAKGDILSASAANTLARLAVGTNGQFLTADSSTTTGLSWTTAAANKVLQIINATTTTPTTIASTTPTDTGITATITPSATSSKILVMATIHGFTSRSAVETMLGARLLRGATTIADWGSELDSINITGATYTERRVTTTITYLDSPATTSATTYKIQGNVGQTTNSGTCTFQYNNYRSVITLFEVVA